MSGAALARDQIKNLQMPNAQQKQAQLIWTNQRGQEG
jgi:hypothetical protein